MESVPPADPRRNRLLAALPAASRERLLDHAELVELHAKAVLHEAHERITFATFPLSGVVSLIALAGDEGVEVAKVGREGMAGLPLFLGGDSMPARAITQVPGAALRVPGAALQLLISTDDALRTLLGRYTQGLLTQIAQSAACNRLHPVDARCARWLLATHDGAGTEAFPVTQEFFAEMLGVRRASVSVAAGVLQRAGYISYSRGRIRVVDRAGLERAACECYRVTAAEYERLLSLPATGVA